MEDTNHERSRGPKDPTCMRSRAIPTRDEQIPQEKVRSRSLRRGAEEMLQKRCGGIPSKSAQQNPPKKEVNSPSQTSKRPE